MIEAIASAKVNLSLHVIGIDDDGLHRLDGVFQSISWMDRLTVETADEDELVAAAGGNVIAGWDNLAWRAVESVRLARGLEQPVRLELAKSIPAAAGLGGGSGDAAAALVAMARICGATPEEIAALAPQLGSDVPFCVRGGTARVRGTGEELVSLDPLGGFALAVVVPPIELATSVVFAKWDELGGPEGPPVGGAALPPPVRSLAPLVNDLFSAAVAVAPLLDEWRAELAHRWGRPVMLTGSGPALFAFFVDDAEAEAALDEVPIGARGTAAVVPIPFGWALREDAGSIAASAPLREMDLAIATAGFSDGT